MAGDMAEELSGYLEVKVPARERKRGFTPWKAWKRQWCMVRRGDSVHAPVQVLLGNGTCTKLQVTHGSTLWRTHSRSKQFAFGVFGGPTEPKKPVLFLSGRSETETQKWMAHFRWLLRPPQQGVEGDFAVSLIDNGFSQSAGLTGAYGNLKVTSLEVTLNDPSSDEVKVTWEWQHLLQSYLAVTGRTEDEKKICVLRTSSDWNGGSGQLYLFCDQAPQLLQSLTRGQQTQSINLSPCPSPLFPIRNRNARRLSRSENDLRQYWSTEEAGGSSSSFIGIKFRRKRFGLRSNSGSQESSKRTSTYSEDSGVAPAARVKLGSSLPAEHKGASSLLTAGLGLVFLTPGGSDADSVHEYQQVGFSASDEDLLGDLVHVDKYRSPRRESGISIASGIYEEIVDHPPLVPEHGGCSPSSPPPPLPPRKRLPDLQIHDHATHFTSLVRSRCFSTSSSPQLHYPYPSSLTSSSCDLRSARNRFFWPPEEKSINSMEPEPDYLPMSPIINRSVAAPMEEQHYMVMASINTT